MTIRLAKADDIPALQAIAVRAYEPYVARMGQEPAPMRPDFADHIAKDTVFVCDEGGVKAFAIIIVGEKKSRCWIISPLTQRRRANGWAQNCWPM